MNRFKRLVVLRRLREEVAAMAVAKANAQVQRLKDKEAELVTETSEGRRITLEDVDKSEDRLPPILYENYVKGQIWRQQRVNQEIAEAKQKVTEVTRIWHGARVLVRQMEHLETRQDELLAQERHRAEYKEMDEVGSVRFFRKQGNG